MEVKAENQTTINKSLFSEGMLRISRDTYGKAAGKAMLVFLGIWALLMVYTILFKGSISQTLGYLILIGLIGLCLCVYMPRNNAKRTWKQQEAKYGSEIFRTTRFFDDHLDIRGDLVEQTISYGDILEVKQSKRLIILVCKNKKGILLAKNRFRGMDISQITALIEGAKAKE